MILTDARWCRIFQEVVLVGMNIKFEHEAAVGTDSCTAAVRVMEKVAPILLKQK